MRPSDDSRLDALVARATQVAVAKHSEVDEEPHRSRLIFISLAVLGIVAIGTSFAIASRDSSDGSAPPAASPVVTLASVAQSPTAPTTPTAPTAATAATAVAMAAPSTTSVAPPARSALAPTVESTAPPAPESTTSTVAPPTSADAPGVLTGPPSERLPGGQPWPSGLYQDDIMYLRGTVPSTEVSTDLQQRAEQILGADNVRNELIIDPSVPRVETVLVRLGNSVLFKSGDFDIPPESEPGFVLWAAFLQSNPSVTVTVIGHADSRGLPESNQQLALQRAQVAADRITRNGVDPSRVTAISRGADDPVAENDTREGRALNRRVEFAVTGLLNAAG